MRYFKILGLLLIIPICSNAQADYKSSWQMGYYGDVIFHPGVKIGYEYALKNWTKTSIKKKGEVLKYKTFNTGIDFMYYWHPKHHHGLIVSPALSYRRIKENGRFFQIKLNLGLHRSLVDGTTYQVEKDGTVSKLGLAGQNTIYNSFSVGFGKDLSIKKEVPIRYYFDMGISGRFPYNHSYLVGFNLGFGIHYLLNSSKNQAK